MPLPNPQRFNTAAQAVQFAIADREKDGTNYDVERVDRTGFDTEELQQLLSSEHYRRYVRLAATLKLQRPANYVEGWIRLNRRHPHEMEILQEFIDRPTRRPKAMNREFHEEINLPLLEYLQTGLLTFLLGTHTPEVYCTAHGGAGYDGRTVGQESVVCALTIYVGRFLCPLRYETTGKGEYRIDAAHRGDPNNPHSYAHLHVYHRARGYHTTIRLQHSDAAAR